MRLKFSPFQTSFSMLRPLLAALLVVLTGPALAETAVAAGNGAAALLHIDWEVKNRFRLFKTEADFARHVAAAEGDGVLVAERRLAVESDGKGWARDMVGHLCIDQSGRIPEFCERDGEREHYMAPRDFAVGVIARGTFPQDATCNWVFAISENETRHFVRPCREEMRLRLPADNPTKVTLDIVPADNVAPAGNAVPADNVVPAGDATRHAETGISVRNLLIAGLGDSIAAGEGNPDRAVALDDGGFCFRRFLAASASEYFRPGRAGFKGDRACTGPSSNIGNTAADWAKLNATWWSATCHRSLYGYQLRAALALAIEQKHIAVTFLPLACSGSSIETGFFNPIRARECPATGPCITNNPSQISRLQEAMELARQKDKDRGLDLVLLTIGANDIAFSGLVADVIIDAPTERTLFTRGGMISDVAASQKMLDRKLPRDFARLRAGLKPYIGDELSRVVFVTYGHPALMADGNACPGGKSGFDVHPAFNADPERLKNVADFVGKKFLPRIRALALCEDEQCKDAASDRMTLVDSHQEAFAAHGFCARADSDPVFDRDCFSETGESFESNPAQAALAPLLCEHRVRNFRPYASRARWIRTANDSYFTAMTFPEGLSPALQPSDLHDATWGAASAVYGGAIHPTAEGHAAMADAALPALRAILELAAPPAVQAETLAPLETPQSQPQDRSPDDLKEQPQSQP